MNPHACRTAVCVLVAGLALAAAARSQTGSPAIRFDGKPDGSVTVTGLTAGDLAALVRVKKSDEWELLFAVHVDRAGGGKAEKQPAVLGTYAVEKGVLHFRPRFPWVPGVRYRASFHPGRLPGRASTLTLEYPFGLPKPQRPATVVEYVYPTRDVLPENQLKFYLHFSAPMSRGEAYPHVRLLDDRGKAVEMPFLELDEELWDGAGRRFTLFFDPGRIKRGLKPREEVGPALEEGKRYTLEIDRGWCDAAGDPLRETYRKRFRVIAPDDTPPDPKTWKLQPPAAGTGQPLTVTFPESMDHALLGRLVTVADAAGRPVTGRVTVGDRETRWRFIPDRPWTAGAYRLVADTRLEDLAGNSIGRAFEVDVFHRVERTVKAETVQVPFTVP